MTPRVATCGHVLPPIAIHPHHHPLQPNRHHRPTTTTQFAACVPDYLACLPLDGSRTAEASRLSSIVDGVKAYEQAVVTQGFFAQASDASPDAPPDVPPDASPDPDADTAADTAAAADAAAAAT